MSSCGQELAVAVELKSMRESSSCGQCSVAERERGLLVEEGPFVPAAVVNRSADEAILLKAADLNFPPSPPLFEAVEGQAPPVMASPLSGEKDVFCMGVQGQEISMLGSIVLQQLLEVLPLRSKLTGGGTSALFPFPTSIACFSRMWPSLGQEVLAWIVCTCLALNSFWGGKVMGERILGDHQRECLESIRSEVERFCSLNIQTPAVDWQEFFAIRGIDYKGDEIKVARWVK